MRGTVATGFGDGFHGNRPAAHAIAAITDASFEELTYSRPVGPTAFRFIRLDVPAPSPRR
ncbi:MAG: hypothetical protein A4E19_04340 [Nitrospira sp. SG-bin1]|nr:MAG: hypothetical protein A4E19_04340 [Nitrospira sp. SG-bin1]